VFEFIRQRCGSPGKEKSPSRMICKDDFGKKEEFV